MKTVKIINHKNNLVSFKTSNNIFDDLQNSPEAFMIISLLLRHKDGYITSISQIKEMLNFKRAAWTKGINFLQEKGYAKMKKKKDSNGQIKTVYLFDINANLK